MRDKDIREMLKTIETILNPERIRLNLLLVSLYITAYELLRNAIVEPIKNFFVYYPGCGENAEQLENEMLDKYEQEVGQKFSNSDNHKLIPSCEWLQKNGVLNEEDINEVKNIRENRHKLAHQLPELIFSEEALIIDTVNLEHLKRIREILRKVVLFWVRIAMDIDDLDQEIQDEDISGAESILDLIISTVFDYLNTGQEDNLELEAG